MMKTMIPILALLATGATATPLDFRQIPADSQWYVHADLDSVKQTSAAKSIAALIGEEEAAKLRAFSRMFGFHPIDDLRAVTLFGSGRENEAAVLVHGKFDRAHLEDLIAAADDHRTRDYQGIVVHTWSDKGKTQNGAFFRDDLVVLSEQPALLEKSLSVLAGRDGAMAERESDGSPLVFGLANLSAMDIKDEDAKLIKEAESVTARLDEKGENMVAVMEVATSDAKLARNLSRMLDGVLAMAELGIPDLDEYNVVSTIDLTDDRTDIRASISIPSDRLVGFLEYLESLKN